MFVTQVIWITGVLRKREVVADMGFFSEHIILFLGFYYGFLHRVKPVDHCGVEVLILFLETSKVRSYLFFFFLI